MVLYSANGYVKDEHLEEIAKNLNNLVALDIPYNLVTDKGLKFIFEKYKNQLKSLKLGNIKTVTQNKIQYLLNLFKQFKLSSR